MTIELYLKLVLKRELIQLMYDRPLHILDLPI